MRSKRYPFEYLGHVYFVNILSVRVQVKDDVNRVILMDHTGQNPFLMLSLDEGVLQLAWYFADLRLCPVWVVTGGAMVWSS